MDVLSVFANRRFRAGSAYELVLFDRLLPEEQLLLGELGRDKEFYGILRAREGASRSIQAVDKNTALLWFTLQLPGSLPSFALSGDQEAVAKQVSLLLLDGVLEIEKEDGSFVSGPAAAELWTDTRRIAATTRLAELSCDALRYGDSLKLDDPQLLAARLYHFGRQPLTPHWLRRLPDSAAVLRFLRAADGDLSKTLEGAWDRTDGDAKSGWIIWSGRSRKDTGKNRPHYKLYVSPIVEDLPAAFQMFLASLNRHRALAFKIGNNAAGLVRPDKFVAYFEDLEQLQGVSAELSHTLSGMKPHGVPFSAEIAHDGLLSWGMDPPATETTLSWQEQESWRLWVVRRLAAAMIAAGKDTQSSMPAWQFAIERLRCMGIDVDQWMPSTAIWQSI